MKWWPRLVIQLLLFVILAVLGAAVFVWARDYLAPMLIPPYSELVKALVPALPWAFSFWSGLNAFMVIAEHRRAARPAPGSSRHVSGSEEVSGSMQHGIWNVPYPRNPNFTGREEVLGQLAGARAGDAQVRTQSISGLGGVGKTQIAVEYAYRHRSEFEIVWWVRGDSTATLSADCAELAKRLELPGCGERDQQVALAALKRWLAECGGWLLVFDNVEDPAVLSPHLPTGNLGQVLITSRSPDWRGIAEATEIGVFSRDKSIDFLLKRTGKTDKEAAAGIAALVGDLPLALEQAGAYIDQERCGLREYVREYERRPTLMLGWLPRAPHYYREPVARTWEISFRRIRANGAAVQLLYLCGFLGSEPIGRAWLQDGARILKGPLGDKARAGDLGEVIGVLARYSLLRTAEEYLAMHQLVQEVVRNRLSGRGKRRWSEAALQVVQQAFPSDSHDFRTWDVCGLLLPHALLVATRAEELGVEAKRTAWLLDRLGRYLRGRANFAGARASFERALKIAERAYGPDHPEVATDVNNLGSVLQELGDLAGARACYERALKIDEPAYGLDHPTVAIRVNNLGSVLQDLGDLAGAKTCYERALKIDERAYGPDHPEVATDVNNLGLVLQELGDLAGAKASFERALKIDEPAYGLDHPTVAIRVNNLGLVLQALGDLAGARAYCERALKIAERAYGSDHPNVATCANNLGRVLQALGDLAEAKACFEQALQIDEKAYGPDHPKVSIRINNLGSVLQALGDLAGARAKFERALHIDEQAYGRDHPKVAIRVNNLGLVLQDLGDLAKAKACYERALRIDEKAYGPHHPEVATDVNNLGSVLQDLGDLAGARASFERALLIFEKALGPQHPRTNTVRANLERLPPP